MWLLLLLLRCTTATFHLFRGHAHTHTSHTTYCRPFCWCFSLCLITIWKCATLTSWTVYNKSENNSQTGWQQTNWGGEIFYIVLFVANFSKHHSQTSEERIYRTQIVSIHFECGKWTEHFTELFALVERWFTQYISMDGFLFVNKLATAHHVNWLLGFRWAGVRAWAQASASIFLCVCELSEIYFNYNYSNFFAGTFFFFSLSFSLWLPVVLVSQCVVCSCHPSYGCLFAIYFFFMW